MDDQNNIQDLAEKLGKSKYIVPMLLRISESELNCMIHEPAASLAQNIGIKTAIRTLLDPHESVLESCQTRFTVLLHPCHHVVAMKNLEACFNNNFIAKVKFETCVCIGQKSKEIPQEI